VMRSTVITALYKIIAGSKLTDYDIEYITEIFHDLYGGFEEYYDYDLKHVSPEEIRKEFAESAEKYNQKLHGFSDPFPVYRAVCVSSVEDIKPDFGAHWTYDKKSADCINVGDRKGLKTFYLEIALPKNKVSWFQTIARLIDDGDAEEELEVNPQSGTYKAEVYDEDWNLVDNITGKVTEVEA